MHHRTKSEGLFEALCAARNVELRGVPLGPDKSPDYEVQLGALCVLAEVKEIEENPREKRISAEERAAGIPFRNTPGARIRPRIKKAAKQLKARAEPGQPGLIVLCNPRFPIEGYTGPDHMRAAMYGELQLQFDRLGECGNRAQLKLGGNRTLTTKHNTTVSAVCSLFRGPEGLYLVAYHNRFAAAPLQPETLRLLASHQFELSEEGASAASEWRPILAA